MTLKRGTPECVLSLMSARPCYQHLHFGIPHDAITLGGTGLLICPSVTQGPCSSGRGRDLPKIPRLVHDLCQKAKLFVPPTTSQCLYTQEVTRDGCAICTAQSTTLRRS